MDPAAIVALAEVSGALICLGWEYFSKVKSAKEDIKRLITEVTTFQNALDGIQKMLQGSDASILPASNSLSKSASTCLSQLKDVENTLDEAMKKSRWGPFRSLKWPFTSKEVDQIISDLERYKNTISLGLETDHISATLNVGKVVEQFKQDYEDTQKTAKLNTQYEYLQRESVDGAAYNFRPPKKGSKSRGHDKEPLGCLEGTRVDLLNEIEEWSADPGGRCIFWLNGMAGTGKSTIARTVARKLDAEGRLGASFFFSRDSGDLDNADRFFTTLAFQLTRVSPNLKDYICNAIADRQGINTMALQDQWKELIFKPLKKLRVNSLSPSPLTFVVDALDECNSRDVREIIRLLMRELDAVKVRAFVTSRPETEFRSSFAKEGGIVCRELILQDVPRSLVEHDILHFLRHEFGEIANGLAGYKDWPGEEKIQIIAQKADGLFIYAATVCRFVAGQGYPSRNLLKLLPADVSPTPTLDKHRADVSPMQALDEMYAKILGLSIHRHETELFKLIVGSIVVLSNPISARTLAKLLDESPSDIGDTLGPLHSVLNISRDDASPIRLLHLSFRDFLIDKERCKDPRFWIDEKVANNILFLRCLELMPKHLKRDICNLQRPGALASEVEKSKIEIYLPLDVQYACRYWVDHLLRSDAILYENGPAHKFLKEHFLHWLEALSIMGKMPEGVLMVTALQSKLAPGGHTELHAIVYDARLFILAYRSIIETAPNQVYSSALIFSPAGSVIRNLFLRKVPAWIKSLPLVENDWSPSLQTLEGHSGWTGAVTFSPDGRLLASVSGDRTVWLWDPATGAAVQTLVGHSNSIKTVVFSPNGRLLASGLDDYTVRLWNPATGAIVQTLEGHSGEISAVAFSPDGRLLASGSGDHTIQLWDSTTGAAVQTLEGHSGGIKAVAFSPDGRLLASGSSDQTVRLWDPATGAIVQTLEGYLLSNYTVAFLLNGQLLASKSNDTVQLWDPATRAIVQTPKSHSGWICAVAFSPDGRLLAFGVSNFTVQLWDITIRAVVQTLKGHSNSILAVAFSPNSRLLASGSEDHTVRLWDPETGAAVQTLKGHSDSIRTVAFSPDSRLLASGSYGTLRLWDPAIRAIAQTLEGHSGNVRTITFSPGGRLLASGSNDSTIRLWDPTTGAVVQTLEGHSGSITQVAFSPDGRLLASGSEDCTIRLWNPATGAVVQMLEGHSRSVRAVAFSPNGRLLASGSDDLTVRLWHPATGAAVQTLEGHSIRILAVVFSPDGRLLASGSQDRTIQLWDPETGAAVQTLEGHSNSIRTVAFSPDGRLFASGSLDHTVRLWDPATGAAVQTLKGHSGEVWAVAFSPDGRLLVSGSDDLTVRLWDPATGAVVQTLEGHADSVQTMFASSYSLDKTRQWITWKTHKVLLLPYNRRAIRFTFKNNILVIAHRSGRLTFLEFKPDINPLDNNMNTAFQ